MTEKPTEEKTEEQRIKEHQMMALGNYRFAVDTAAYQELRHTTPFTWSEKSRSGRRPALKFTGIGKETIELSGTIYPSYKGGLGQLEAMRKEARRGKPLHLSDGFGNTRGRWCIESIEDTQTFFLPNGIPRKQTFRLTLSAYGDDT
ncbi:phage tail protein [Desulfoluna spongiiphila]|uniref:Phage P2 GpU n=1 Tax=Desulfoluna spongiiphila TaxID=419481 RepID=A0A1G5ACZ2_9BACT|nr:phage tail protein [Desulfoluna spongiiphila]SCX75733.1 hypothetical protein SAMN05216233_10160 [Desulfoluna spongiiphila]